MSILCPFLVFSFSFLSSSPSPPPLCFLSGRGREDGGSLQVDQSLGLDKVESLRKLCHNADRDHRLIRRETHEERLGLVLLPQACPTSPFSGLPQAMEETHKGGQKKEMEEKFLQNEIWIHLVPNFRNFRNLPETFQTFHTFHTFHTFGF